MQHMLFANYQMVEIEEGIIKVQVKSMPFVHHKAPYRLHFHTQSDWTMKKKKRLKRLVQMRAFMDNHYPQTTNYREWVKICGI